MNSQIKNRNEFIFATGLVLLASVSRIFPHIPNVSPINAIALFGGVYFSKRMSLIVPILSMFISDLFIGFHSTMFFVYSSFLLTVFLGWKLNNRKTVLNTFFTSATSSILFFVITNFGVWMTSNSYSINLSGLVQCYIAAIPFFRNSLLGDLGFVFLIFGVYEFVSKKILVTN